MSTLSLIIPNYNDAPLLERAIKNAFVQKRIPDHVILIDDGSTDNSLEIIARLQREFPIIVLKNTVNCGVRASLQRALDHVNTDYVHFLGADEKLAPAFYTKSMALLEANAEAGLCVSDAILESENWSNILTHGFSETAKYLPPADFAAHQNGMHIHGVGTIYKTSYLEESKYFAQDLRWHHDWFASCVMALRYGACHIPENLATLAVRDKSWSTSGRNNWEEQRRVIENAFRLVNSPEYADILPLFIMGRAMNHFTPNELVRAFLDMPYLMTGINRLLARDALDAVRTK